MTSVEKKSKDTYTLQSTNSIKENRSKAEITSPIPAQQPNHNTIPSTDLLHSMLIKREQTAKGGELLSVRSKKTHFQSRSLKADSAQRMIG